MRIVVGEGTSLSTALACRSDRYLRLLHVQGSHPCTAKAFLPFIVLACELLYATMNISWHQMTTDITAKQKLDRRCVTVVLFAPEKFAARCVLSSESLLL